jgi:hypothetical protein
MSTAENRSFYDRGKLRYRSGLTDAEWRRIGPLISPAKRGGGKRRVDMREVVNGVMDAEHWMPVALHPERSAAARHGERLLLPVGRRRRVGEDAPRALRQMPRAG